MAVGSSRRRERGAAQRLASSTTGVSSESADRRVRKRLGWRADGRTDGHLSCPMIDLLAANWPWPIRAIDSKWPPASRAVRRLWFGPLSGVATLQFKFARLESF